MHSYGVCAGADGPSRQPAGPCSTLLPNSFPGFLTFLTWLCRMLCPSIAADHSLRLGGKGVSSKQDAEALGRLFASLSSLHHLDLSGNHFGNQGSRALGPHLAGLSSLQRFDLQDNRIGAESARALGPHLPSLSSLQHLDISWNHIGTEGARALGPHLASLSSLRRFDLQDAGTQPRAVGGCGGRRRQEPSRSRLRVAAQGSCMHLRRRLSRP